MPSIPFDPNLHQKVRYTGNQYIRYRKKLFVVHLKDYDFERMGDNDFMVIHIVNRHGVMNYNKSDTTQPIFMARKSDLVKVDAEVNE